MKKQTQDSIISDVFDAQLEKKKKRRRQGDDKMAFDESKGPKNYMRKKKTQNHSHSSLIHGLTENSDVHTDDNESSVRKRKTWTRKTHSADNVTSASERAEVITCEKITVNDADKEAVDTSKRKKKKTHSSDNVTAESVRTDVVTSLSITENEAENTFKRKKKKKDKAQRLSVCEEATVNDNKDDIRKSAEEAEEMRRQQRKQKKKDKKLKKLEQKDVKGTSSETKEVGPSSCQLGLEYLSQWDKDRKNWRFQKVRQVWLLHNMYDENKVDNSCFKTLLLYLDGLKGKSRETTVKQAEDILALDEDSDAETKDVSEVKLDRARQLIQVLT